MHKTHTHIHTSAKLQVIVKPTQCDALEDYDYDSAYRVELSTVRNDYALRTYGEARAKHWHFTLSAADPVPYKGKYLYYRIFIYLPSKLIRDTHAQARARARDAYTDDMIAIVTIQRITQTTECNKK